MSARDAIVCVRPALALEPPLRFAAGERALAPECVRAAENLADAFALEAALELRERGELERVTCLSAGSARADAALAAGLAAGADRALRIEVPDDAELDEFAIGALLAAAVAHLGGALVLAAQASDDRASGIVPGALAHALGAAYFSNALSLRLRGDEVEVERRLERGDRERWAARLPALVAIEGGAAPRRYVSVAALALARQRPIERLSPGAIGMPLEALPRRLTRVRLAAPRVRAKRTAAPAASLSAAERLRRLTGGGSEPERARLRGDPATVAEEVVRFLRQRGLLGPRRG